MWLLRLQQAGQKHSPVRSFANRTIYKLKVYCKMQQQLLYILLFIINKLGLVLSVYFYVFFFFCIFVWHFFFLLINTYYSLSLSLSLKDKLWAHFYATQISLQIDTSYCIFIIHNIFCFKYSSNKTKRIININQKAFHRLAAAAEFRVHWLFVNITIRKY